MKLAISIFFKILPFTSLQNLTDWMITYRTLHIFYILLHIKPT